MRRLYILPLAISLFLASGMLALADLPDPGNGKTDIYIQNIGTDASTISLVFTTGEIGGQADVYNVPDAIVPKGMKVVPSTSFPSGISQPWSGSVEVQASDYGATVVNVFWDRPDLVSEGKAAASYVGIAEPAKQAYLPMLAIRNPYQTSRVIIQNTEDTLSTVYAHWYDRNGVENTSKLSVISLPAKTQKIIDVGAINPFTTTGGIGSAYITSTTNIAVLASTHFGPVDNWASDVYPAFTDGDDVIIVPSVFRKTGLCGDLDNPLCYESYNVLNIQNIDNSNATVRVEFWSYWGALTYSYEETIEPKRTRPVNTAVRGQMDPAIYSAMRAALTDNWRGSIKVISTGGQKLAVTSQLFAARSGARDCIYYVGLREDQATAGPVAFPMEHRVGSPPPSGGTPPLFSAAIIQNFTSNSGNLTVDIFNANTQTFVGSYQIPIPANGTTSLNTGVAMTQGLTQDMLNAIGTNFVGCFYVTPPPGVKIGGVTMAYWTGSSHATGRCSGYAGIAVPQP